MQYRFSNKANQISGSAVEEILRFAGDPSVISLAGGNPATETFPNQALAEIARELLMEQPALSLQYNKPRGYGPFVELMRQRLKEHDGIGRDFDDLFIVTGGTQAVDLCWWRSPASWAP